MKLDFTRTSILVIGDLMLDQYYYGKVNRISPEAPVPVVKIEKTKWNLGGAGNVSSNLIGLKAVHCLTGITGQDENEKILTDLLHKENIKSELVEAPQMTTTKTRIIGEHQQMIRLDFEDVRATLPENIIKQLKSIIAAQMQRTNTFILSDYGKGVCQPEICQYVIQNASADGKTVIVDPKGSDWSKYRKATVVTPNVKELTEAAGTQVENTDADIEKAGKELIQKYDLKYLLVTRSDKGMSFIEKNQAYHIPTDAREVYDVSGAGDTVVAALAACVSSGMDWLDAVRTANRAAGIVVGKFGTAPVLLDELQESFTAREISKILNHKTLMEKLKKLRHENKKIVFTNGCFDILHAGHVTYLRKAKDMGDVLIIGLNSDSSVSRLKGSGRPVNKEIDRATVLASMEFVDYVIFFTEDTPHELIKSIKPDLLVKGGDYKADEVVGREFAGQTVIIPLLKGYSTTHIITKISGGDK